MNRLTALNARLSRWTMYLACLSLMGLLLIVMYGVVLRYLFNDMPPYVEQVALLLVVTVAMLGASAGVRDAGHIGLDSVVNLLNPRWQFWCQAVVYVLCVVFAVALLVGGIEMAVSTEGSTIPTLGVSEAWRYVPVLAAGVLISLFSIERLLALFMGKKVVPSWH